MTQEEIRKFIYEAIGTSDTEKETIQRITDRWQDEVDAAFQRGVHAGQKTFDPNFLEN